MHDLILKVAIMLLSPLKYLFSTEIEIWATVLWHKQIVLAYKCELFLATGFETGTPYGRFVIEGWKQHNSDFESHFSKLKIGKILLIFFHWRIQKRESNFYHCNIWITFIFYVLCYKIHLDLLWNGKNVWIYCN